MVKDKVKKEFSLLLVLMLMAAFLTGCSDITNIALKDDGSGSYEETVTISKILWDSASEIYGGDEGIVTLLQTSIPGAEITLKDTNENGTECKQLIVNCEFKDTKAFQQTMSLTGVTSVKFNQKYFSRSAIYMPVEGDSQMSALTDQITALIGDNTDLLKALTAEMQNMNIQMTIEFPYAVTDTNGRIQDDGKTVMWNSDMLIEGSQTRLYAAFGEQKSAEAPVFTGASNGKNYKSGVTLNIDSENLLDKVDINGASVSSDFLFLSDEGTYKITATDKGGNSSKIQFMIDTTKPAIKGVSDNKTYTGERTIKFSDKGSGIKSAKLNNKTIKSGASVAKKGSYTLVVTDKAGNKKTVKFKIK